MEPIFSATKNQDSRRIAGSPGFSFAGFNRYVPAERVAGQAGMAEARGIRFLHEVTHDVHILGDALPLRQAVVNLLDNAVRYTIPGGHALVTLHSEDEPAMKESAPAQSDAAARRVRLVVENTHPPLSPETLQRIFEPFYRAGSGDNADGSGLGLALVQRIIALHGGEVAAENAERAGESMFQISVRLPAQLSAPVDTA